jgi:hypothetical protein
VSSGGLELRVFDHALGQVVPDADGDGACGS